MGGYAFETTAEAVFFAGDTAYAEHFTEIRARVGPIGLALLPIAHPVPAASANSHRVHSMAAG